MVRVCKCDPFDKCPDCEKRYLMTVETATRDNDHFYCYDTREEMDEAYNQVEKTNEYMGTKYAPCTAIRFCPVSER